MNFALGAILILFLITPGFLFRSAFLTGPYSNRFFRQSTTDEIFYSLVPAFAFQLIGAAVVSVWYDIDYKSLYFLITGNARGDDSLINFPLIRQSLFPFLVYSLTLLALAYGGGKAFRAIINHFHLDINRGNFRLNNEWYYVLTGRILNTPENRYASRKIRYIQVDAMVNEGADTWLYCGILDEFYLSQTDGLDRIVLYYVFRRKISEDLPLSERDSAPVSKSKDERYYRMPGDYLVLPYRTITNMNITYHTYEEVT
ncbi:MAG: hypothetical protein AAF632_21995 [Bacteroidota bacterium]